MAELSASGWAGVCYIGENNLVIAAITYSKSVRITMNMCGFMCSVECIFLFTYVSVYHCLYVRGCHLPS